MNLFKFKPNFAAPASSTFTGPTAVGGVASYTPACGQNCVPQPGTTQKLDVLGDRLMYRLTYRNLGNREALLVNHSVVANSTIGVRWYEFNVSNFNVSVRQQGTYAPNDGQYRWMGSIGIDKIGNVAVGFSIGSGTQQASIRFAGREITDPLNSMSMDTNMHTGTGSQLANLGRWGDYSSMTIDPVDDCTFWYTTEYLKASGTFNWSTRIGSFKFSSCNPEPGMTVDVVPASRTITAGESTTYTATVAAQNGYTGSGTFSVTGLPSDATSSFETAGFTSGSGSTTLTVTTTATTTPGTYQLTITAADTSNSPADSEVVTLVVNPPAPTGGFTLGASPSSRSIAPGQFTTFDATVAAQSGYEGSGSFSVTGLPTGADGSFSPTGYANGGGQSTLTVTTDASTPAGTYVLIITATDTNGTPVQSTSVSLTVTSAAEPDFTLSATPGTLVVKRGKSGSYNVTVTPAGGFNETVSLSYSGLPGSTTGSFSAAFLNGGGTSALTITTAAQTPKGTFTVTITATSASKTRSTTVTLKVN
jgi:hypothetical protein